MNCGTRQGWQAHKARNEPPCKWCVKAATNPAPVVVKVKKQVTPRIPRERAGGGPISKAVCGETSGFHKHKSDGTPICDPCRLAINTSNRKRYKEARNA